MIFILNNFSENFQVLIAIMLFFTTIHRKCFHFNMLRTRIHIPRLDFVHVFKVILQDVLVLEHPRANVALEGLDVTNTMHSCQVNVQVAFRSKLLLANLTLKSCLISWSLCVRRVVVRADR